MTYIKDEEPILGGKPADYITPKEASAKWGISERRIQKLCVEEKNNFHSISTQITRRSTKEVPDGLDIIFFSDNGSAAIEVALKMSFQYHQQTGKVKKQRFAALRNAYHGETLGALSVGDLDLYSKVYNPFLLNTLRLESPDCYRCVYLTVPAADSI